MILVHQMAFGPILMIDFTIVPVRTVPVPKKKDATKRNTMIVWKNQSMYIKENLQLENPYFPPKIKINQSKEAHALL